MKSFSAILAFISLVFHQPVFGLTIGKPPMKLEVTKIYRTSMTVNLSENYTVYYDTSTAKKIILNEAADGSEKQDGSIKIQSPQSYEIEVSKGNKQSVTLALTTNSTKLQWVKYDSKGVAGPYHTFEKTIELKEGELVEITREPKSDPPFYAVSFRIKLSRVSGEKI